jgi:hypothetical protein
MYSWLTYGYFNVGVFKKYSRLNSTCIRWFIEMCGIYKTYQGNESHENKEATMPTPASTSVESILARLM